MGDGAFPQDEPWDEEDYALPDESYQWQELEEAIQDCCHGATREIIFHGKRIRITVERPDSIRISDGPWVTGNDL